MYYYICRSGDLPTNCKCTHAQQLPNSTLHQHQITPSKRNFHNKAVEYGLSKGIHGTSISNNKTESNSYYCDNTKSAGSNNTRTLENNYNMSETQKIVRDRLGLWGTGNDAEVAGAVSGLGRLNSGRYNKVSFKHYYYFFLLVHNIIFYTSKLT